MVFYDFPTNKANFYRANRLNYFAGIRIRKIILRMYYSISKKLITKTAEGTKLHWALNLFVKDGKKLDSSDYFLVSAFAAICTIYL